MIAAVQPCIFCNQSTGQPSSEHLVSEWMGCRVTLKGLVCRDCNSRFGSGPEGELHRLLRPFDAVCNPGRSQSRNQTVWEGEIWGETRPFRVNLNSGQAEPTSPVVSKEESPEGSTKYRVSGTDRQIEKIKKSLDRKGGPVLFEQTCEPGTTGIDLSTTYDWSGLYGNDALTAVAKFAAGYSWWALGDQPVSRVLSEKAFQLLQDAAQPPEFVAPVCSFDLLNRMKLTPESHSLFLAPSESNGVYCVVVVLYGLVPYLVRSAHTSQRLDVVQAHRFGVGRDDPPSEKVAICGSPELDLESLWPEDDRARNRWIQQIALNAHDHLATVGEKSGFDGLSFEQVLPDPENQ